MHNEIAYLNVRPSRHAVPSSDLAHLALIIFSANCPNLPLNYLLLTLRHNHKRPIYSVGELWMPDNLTHFLPGNNALPLTPFPLFACGAGI